MRLNIMCYPLLEIYYQIIYLFLNLLLRRLIFVKQEFIALFIFKKTAKTIDSS